MSAAKKDPEILALESVYSALKGLDSEIRGKVLASVCQLLDIKGGADNWAVSLTPQSAPKHIETTLRPPRPLSLNELINDKKPGTSAQFITLFAYYREKYEGQPRFSRSDLSKYFPKAKQTPPGNYDRDFVEAVKKGWIHEDKADSYITSKGIEAVESGFEGEVKRGPSRSEKKAKKSK
jgi:hypothetical protein